MENSDEIDLRYLFEKIASLFEKAKGYLLSIISFFIKNMIFLILGVIIFVSISIGATYMIKPYYESSLILNVRNQIAKNVSYRLFSFMNQLISNKEYESLGELLNISSEAAETITKVQFKEEKDISQEQNSIYIKIWVSTHDNSIFPSIEKGIINNLKSNNYLKEELSLSQKYNKEIIEKIQKELLQLDSLKKTIEISLINNNKGNGLIYGQPINPVSVYEKEFDLFTKQLTYEKETNLLSYFRIVDSFKIKSSPSGPLKTIFAFYGALIGFFMTIIGLLLFRKK